MATEHEKAAAMEAVERTHAAFCAAMKRGRLVSKPESVEAAQKELRETEAAYREASDERDRVFGHAPVKPANPVGSSRTRRSAKVKAAKILHGGADDTTHDRERLVLVMLAKNVAKNSRGAARELAKAVLDFFGDPDKIKDDA